MPSSAAGAGGKELLLLQWHDSVSNMVQMQRRRRGKIREEGRESCGVQRPAAKKEVAFKEEIGENRSPCTVDER